MDITVPSGWKVKPGQYVYLWLTQAGLRVASQLPFFNVSSWEGPLGASDTGAPTSELVDLSGQRAPIHASEQSASPEDTLREAETSVPDNTSLRSAEQGVEWRQVGPKRDAAVHPTIPRHISRGRASSNTAMGHRTLRVLARPQSSALATALYNAHIFTAFDTARSCWGQDIGIARVFSLIPTLVLTSEQHRAMVRKLIVVRQMEDLDNRRWVNMQHLLDLDHQESKVPRPSNRQRAYMIRVSSNILHPQAWIYAQFAIANIASAILVTSNPTNLVLTSAFEIKFIDYMANMIVPVVITAIVLFPFLLYIIFADQSLVPLSIEMHELPEEAKNKSPVNPNIPKRGGIDKEQGNEAASSEDGKLLSLEEILNPFLDKRGAGFGIAIMAATLITVLTLDAANQGHTQPVFWVTLPAAFVFFCWDIAYGWLHRHETHEIARRGQEEMERMRAERVVRGGELAEERRKNQNTRGQR